ncbi:MAG: SEC-C domain-containing protein [Saccharospirillaceae bacterium]|nr:SEC-C domain-containing protein [Saccharospirillaceae bacterium]
MKIGRNDTCPCGSGKKYKRCCIKVAAKHQIELVDEITQIANFNPQLSNEDLDVVLQHKINDRNHSPIADFCGLSPEQLFNWLYEPINELTSLEIHTPNDYAASPVMRYLEIIFEEASQNNGEFKGTARGNLPAKLVKKAANLLPEFPVVKYERIISISEFAGNNEDKFNALHYTKIIAEITGLIQISNGKYRVKNEVLKRYQTDGVNAFFQPMLNSAIREFNWAYFDGFQQDLDIRPICIFMLWRIQVHKNLEKLTEEVIRAFPDLLDEIEEDVNITPEKTLGSIIETRFVKRFLQYWGFIILDPKLFKNGVAVSRVIEIQPLFEDTFVFGV